MKIIIASRNPIKINATKLAFEQMFPNKVFQFEVLSYLYYILIINKMVIKHLNAQI